MENQKFKAMAAISFMSVTILFATAMYLISQPVKATGGGEVIELVIPIIDDATKAVQEGDKDKALALLDEIKTELKDTFFAEEEN